MSPQRSKQRVGNVPYSPGLLAEKVSGVSMPRRRTLSVLPSANTTSMVSPSTTLETWAAIPLVGAAVGVSGVGAVGADVVGNGMTPVGTGLRGSDMGVAVRI